MSHLAIFALGPLRIELDGQPLQTSRHKALALLVYLAMRPGGQSREALSALLWPDYEQEKAYAYLRRTLWELHALLGEGWLEADREKIGLCQQSEVTLDVSEFKGHLEAFEWHHPQELTGSCQECLAHLSTAALLYRGDFMAGFGLRDSPDFEDWCFFQAEELRRAYAGALQSLANLLVQEGSFAEAAGFAQRWLALDTLNEEAHRLLMKIYDHSGQRHLALRQYQECQQVLQKELGVAPEPATQALYEEILSGNLARQPGLPIEPGGITAQNLPESSPTAISLKEASPVNERQAAGRLPAPSTAFIGRERELSQIASLLADPDCWLLTLFGTGGIGKTRLAVEVGRKLASNFLQGVCFVSLSMAETEQSIAPAVARALGLIFRQNGPPPEEQVIDFLRNKHLLLILDSFEQLVPWAGLLERIHSQAPGVRLLVTSRHRLLLQGEWVMEIKGLDYPRDPSELISVEGLQGYSALELFQHAARRSRVTFEATTEDLAAIIQIAQLLEGMPLGLELAATWINVLSCQEIAAEIHHGLDILETPLGDVSDWQRSMRAVFNHSWKLLSPREQTILPRLAVFRGSFSRQAAERVAGVSIRDLSALVDKSLVRRTSNGRFDLHDLLRQYLAEILGRSPSDSHETRRRQSAFYSSQFIEWNGLLRGEKQGLILREIETDLENIRAAWEWSLDQEQPAQLEQMADGLGMFYLRRARLQEGWETYQKANAVLTNITTAQEANLLWVRLSARLLTWQAALSMNLEHFDESGQLVHEAQRKLSHPHLDPDQVIHERIFTLVILALVTNLQHNPAASLDYFHRVIQLSRQSSEKCPQFFIFYWRFLMGGSVSQELYLEIERNLEYIRQSGDPFELGCVLNVLGIAELFHGYRLERAEPLLRESTQNLERVEDPSTRVMVFNTLGYLLLTQGKFDDCYELKRRELAVIQDIGDLRLIGIAQAEIGEVLCHLGKYSEAEEKIRTGMALLRERSEVEYALRQRYLGDVLLACGRNEEARKAYEFSFHYFQSVDEKGWMFTALTGLSRTELACGNHSEAWLHAREALQLYAEIRLYTFFAYLTVANLSLLLTDQGEIQKSLELYGLVTRSGFLAQSRWFADLYGKAIEAAASRLTVKEQTEARDRFQVFDIASIMELARLPNV